MVRFTKAIGFDGFSDFKSQILRDWGSESSLENSHNQKFVDLNISPRDNLEDIPQKIVNSSIKGLEDTMKIFDYEAYQKAVNCIVNANRIEIFGLGTSSSIALDFAVDTLKIAKEAGATTIALTNYKASHIAKYADIDLLTGDHETTFYSETMISRMSLLSLVDMLYMGVLLSDYEKYTSILHKINLLVENKNY
ncbi:MurR/RpiR family transcriptional regulator [Enterococcus hulanensis]|uniref:MurR/RpiR family transcriptional regulator n=1 Tax=Enterococcus hulanensis TaxID=2559929 RepID=UPI000B65C1BD|nr:MurR/RpiR family transcriptional regulator [Enterococcus hulanensis]MBO0409513.1 MurR/RpiR family transcriptional regulator [Enterococcus hulanensis]OTO15325.1 hypothetical protein A5875_004483 [Enterococcus sp. 3H8_DIV0648]